jgi:hypothetical protein
VLLHDPLLEVGTTASGWAHQHTAAEIRAGRLRNVDGTRSEERPLLLDELLDLAPPAATLQLEIKGMVRGPLCSAAVGRRGGACLQSENIRRGSQA